MAIKFTLEAVEKFYVLTFKQMTKKSTVNKVPVSGSNFRLPNKTTTTKCKTAMKMSRDMTSIQGTRNSLWSFLKPIKTKSDENVPNNPQPSEVMLKYTFAVARERNKLKPRRTQRIISRMFRTHMTRSPKTFYSSACQPFPTSSLALRRGRATLKCMIWQNRSAKTQTNGMHS